MAVTRTIRSVLIAFVAFAALVVQALELGNLSLTHANASPISSVTFSRSPVGFTRFAVRIGGVAFTTTATGKDGIAISDLRYDPTAADGMRLKVKLRDRAGRVTDVAASIYDWQLIPLVHFVESDGTSAVTLFGELATPEATRKARAQHNMIANYHPALQDTLLGLRLLQADMLVFEPNAADLFRDNGTYILGAGEEAPNPERLRKNREALEAISAWRNGQKESFRSYVTGDVDVRVGFAAKDGKLILTGEPSWFCWDQDEVAIEKHMARNAESTDAFLIAQLAELSRAQKQVVARVLMAGGKVDDTDALEKEIFIAQQRFVRSVQTRMARDPQSSLVTMEEVKAAARAKSFREIEPFFAHVNERLEASTETQQQTWRRQIGSLRGAIDDVPVKQMTSLSAALSAKVREHGGVNPVVYDALKTSVQFAAFLRAAKRDAPSSFASLARSVSKVSPSVRQPQNYRLITPTLYPRGSQ